MKEAARKEGTVRELPVSEVPTCPILGVRIAAIDMKAALAYIQEHLRELSGNYICISNVHTTVTSYEDAEYRKIQNGGALALPDGKPLSVLCRKRGFAGADRVTGPDLMREIFDRSEKCGYRHYFYGSTPETLKVLEQKLKEQWRLNIVGLESPPFRALTPEEDAQAVERINASGADFVWIGLGAPKQERWMAAHQGRVQGLMIGVGAGFDYFAGNIKRAPMWMQKLSLEWLYRLLQDPKRLFRRYLVTNTKFLWLTARGK